ncbi:unnamed protein product [Brassica rapa]|uniref:Uncharacterized protein n=1 Tax=Brassica campestris TaxID=3711 RepID=A0A8D9HMI9_BRACM|nr:unnamed protein product [Brassica rapa]
MENDDGGQRGNRRKSLRHNKNVGVDVGGSISPRRSSRNRTTSPEEEATGRAKRLSKQPANGDDAVTIMQYPEPAMPQHAGLSVVHIRKAEHDPLVSIISQQEPIRKQRRISGFFRRGGSNSVDTEKFAALEGRVNECFVEVEKLKSVCEKQGRTIKILKQRLKASIQKKYRRSAIKVRGADAKRQAVDKDPDTRTSLAPEHNADVCGELDFPEGGNLDGFPGPDEQRGGAEVFLAFTNVGFFFTVACLYKLKGSFLQAEHAENAPVEVTTDGISQVEQGCLDDLVGAVMRKAGVLSELGEAKGQGGVILLESIPGPPMVGMSDLSVAPTQAGVSCEDSAKRSGLVEEFMVVSGENKDKVEKPMVVDKVVAEFPVPVPVIMVASIPAAGLTGKPVGGSAAPPIVVYNNKQLYTKALQDEIDGDKKSDQEQAVVPKSGGKANVVVRDDEIGSGDDLTDEDAAEVKEGSGTVVLSDSPTEVARKHVPVADEEELAALLLAKSPLALQEMVPLNEDVDYPFFERVLQANPKAYDICQVAGLLCTLLC